MGCTTRTAWFDGCNVSWLLPPGTFKKRCWLETAAVPPTAATPSQSGPGKLLDIGAAGTAGTGPTAKADCPVATIASEQTIAKRYCDLLLYMYITPGCSVLADLQTAHRNLLPSVPTIFRAVIGNNYQCCALLKLRNLPGRGLRRITRPIRWLRLHG